MPCKFTSCCCWKIWRRRDDCDDDYVKASKKDAAKVGYQAGATAEVKDGYEAKPYVAGDVKVTCEEEKAFKVAEEFKVKADEASVKDHFEEEEVVDGGEDEEEDSVFKHDDERVEDGGNGEKSPGNPRNKCALQPGHSLMDWIRLGSSGKDLTGVGPRAGHLSVTKHELSQHNKEYDAWLAIRGKVYNVTAYLPFHPGGSDELMRGVGIDATRLFDQIHPWVNYEQILQKCFVGRLVAFEPGTNVEALFFEHQTTQKPSTDADRTKENKEEPQKQEFKEPKVKFLEKYPPKVDSVTQDDLPEDGPQLPRFDWIQRTRFVNLVFYTNAFSNALVEVMQPDHEGQLVVNLFYDDTIFTNTIALQHEVSWPCAITISYESGKVDLEFQKPEEGLWEDVGVLKQVSEPVGDRINSYTKCNYVVREKMPVTHNIFLVRLERTDGARMVVPIGRHVRAFVNVDGQEMARSYTPIPQSFFKQFTTQGPCTDNICLMIKRYDEGNVSRYITDRDQNEVVYLTKPIGDFDLRVLQKRDAYLLLAAGTGITPMLSLIQFLLERRIKKCQFARLLFFNKTEEDIPFRDQFNNFEKMDNRLNVTHVLSEPNKDWKGLTGHVSETMLHDAIKQHILDTGYTIHHVFTFICGPNPFVTLSIEELKKLGIDDDQIYAFQG